MATPELVKAFNLPKLDNNSIPLQLSFIEKKDEYLNFNNELTCVEWVNPSNVAWIPCECFQQLYGGKYSLDFKINMKNRQIGVGFMLKWDQGLDWGFFGYLGASSSAWSYDPLSGDVVTSTKSIESGLNTFSDEGIVHLELDLPLKGLSTAKFSVNDKESSPIELPESSVVVIACCLLKHSQKIEIMNFKSELY